MKPAMSRKAVTQRLRRTAELRQVCLALHRKPAPKVQEKPSKYRPRNSSGQS